MMGALRKIGRPTGIGLLWVAVAVPLVLIGAVIVGTVRRSVDPPLPVRHAEATTVAGYDVVATTEADIAGGLAAYKIFIGPVVDRPQDRIAAPGAELEDMYRPGQPDSTWLSYGDYPDGCHISVDQITGGTALRSVTELSASQRDTVSTGENLVLELKFFCGDG